MGAVTIKATRRGVLGLGLTVMAGVAGAPLAEAGVRGRTTLNLATYNIFSKEFEDRFPDNLWKDRREAMGKIIRQRDNNPDILAIQEGQVAEQVTDLITTLGGRWRHHMSEMTLSPRAIFWRAGMFKALDQGEVEILGPEVVGHDIQRFGTFVRLRHLVAGGELLVLNVHLPVGGTAELQTIRHDAVQRIADQAEQWSEQYDGIPVIVMGDFNNYWATVIDGVPSAPWTMVDLGFQETYRSAAPETRVNPDYKSKIDIVKARAASGPDGLQRLDYIFVRSAHQVTTLDWRMIMNLRDDSEFDLETPVPSDHHPTASRVQLTWS